MLPDESSFEHDGALEKLGKSPVCEVSQVSKSVPNIIQKGLRFGTRNF